MVFLHLLSGVISFLKLAETCLIAPCGLHGKLEMG